MMTHKNKLVLEGGDLDHIIDIDLSEGNKEVPPSELFIIGLERELALNGMELSNIDVIEVEIPKNQKSQKQMACLLTYRGWN